MAKEKKELKVRKCYTLSPANVKFIQDRATKEGRTESNMLDNLLSKRKDKTV